MRKVVLSLRWRLQALPPIWKWIFHLHVHPHAWLVEVSQQTQQSLAVSPFHGSCTMNAKDDPSSSHPAATDGGWIEKASEAKDLSRVLPHAKQMCHSCSRPKAQPAMQHSCSRRCSHSPKKGPKWPVSFHQACCNGLSQWRPLQCRWSDSNKDQLRKPAAGQFL